MLTLDEMRLLESRFKSREQSMIDADEYNNMLFDTPNAIASAASDTLCGYKNNEEMASM
jgi:hypothetical protein